MRWTVCNHRCDCPSSSRALAESRTDAGYTFHKQLRCLVVGRVKFGVVPEDAVRELEVPVTLKVWGGCVGSQLSSASY